MSAHLETRPEMETHPFGAEGLDSGEKSLVLALAFDPILILIHVHGLW